MSITRTIAKNTMFNFITHASDSVVNFGVGVLLARYLGAADYGLYSFLIWFLYFLALFANLGLGNMVLRYIAEAVGRQNQGDVKNVISIAVWFRVGIVVLLMLIVIIFSSFWSDVFGHPGSSELFIILAIGFAPHMLNFLFSSIFGGFQKFEYGAYLMLGTNPLRAIGIVIVAAMGLGVREVLFASIGSWVLGVFIGLFLLRRLIPLKDIIETPKFTPETKSALKYSMIMFGVFLISYFMTQRAEVLFLGIFHPGETVAFYTVAFLLTGASIGLILAVFSTVLTPAISEQVGRGDMDRVRKLYLMSARYLMAMGIPLAIGAITLASSIIHTFYGAEYAPVIPIFRILYFPFAILSIASAATSIIFAINRPSFVFKVGLGLIVISISLDLWLIPLYGGTGAAVASSVARLIAPILYIRFASRACQTSWPLLDTIKISISAVIMGGIIFLLERLIDIPVVAFVVLVPLGAIIHFIGLIMFRVITLQDIDTARHIQEGLPGLLSKIGGVLLGFTEKLIKKRGIPEN